MCFIKIVGTVYIFGNCLDKIGGISQHSCSFMYVNHEYMLCGSLAKMRLEVQILELKGCKLVAVNENNCDEIYNNEYYILRLLSL